MKLSDGKTKHMFEIKNIDIDIRVRRRLQDMGLTTGSTVRIMSHYSNNAIVLNVRRSRVVIGKDIAENIEVEEVEDECLFQGKRDCDGQRKHREGRHRNGIGEIRGKRGYRNAN